MMSHSEERAELSGAALVQNRAEADTARACRLFRRAAESTSTRGTTIADAASVVPSKATGWLNGTSAPSLMHLVRLAETQPNLIEAVARELVALSPNRKHVTRPLPERCLHLLTEVGDVAREVQTAVADGNVDAGEAASIRRELQHARQVLDAIERDLAGKLGGQQR